MYVNQILPSLGLFLFACDSDKGVTVFNPNPEAEIISHSDGDEVLEGYVITLVGNVSDANHSAEQLTTTWKLGAETLCEATPQTDGATSCSVVFSPEETEITLEVKDPDNARGDVSISLVVVPSEAPVAQIISPEANGIFYSDQKITFEGIISDEEDDADQLIATWKSDLEGILSSVDTTPQNDGSILGYGYLSQGEHAIELLVEDSTGKTDRASVIINVGAPNSAPLCDILSPEEASVGRDGENVIFTATAEDVDIAENMLVATWYSDKDGDLGNSVVNSDGTTLLSISDLSVNTHVVSLTVADEVGATCTSSITYTVGSPPNITIQTPIDGETINQGTSILFSAAISDAQDQPNEISLDWSLNGVSVSSQGATSSGVAEFSNATLGYGTYNLVVTATDTDGLSDSDQINFTINGIPSQPQVAITPTPADTSLDLTAEIVVASEDPEGSLVSYTYEWHQNNTLVPMYTTETIPALATSKGDTWTVYVTPNDGAISGQPGMASLVIENTPPLISGISISPTVNIYNDDTLTCAAIVTDPDETPIVTYQWTAAANVLGTTSTIDLSTTAVMPEDVVTCTITATDASGASVTDSTDTTIINRSPALSNTSIIPATGITTASLLTCATSITDEDGESLTANYIWSVGANNNAGTGATLQLTPSMGAPGEGIVCTVDVADGYGGSAVDVAVAIIGNTPPTITASISANGSTNTGELTCFAVASDVDDAPTIPSISYEWFDGSGASLGTMNPILLDSSMGVDGDDISCVATATDLSGGSASDTATHTITNTPPVIDSISLSPVSPDVHTSALMCNVIGSDADGDTVTFTYEWLVNNQPQTETTNMFTGPFIVGSIIACRSTPNDGKIDGIVEEDTATVSNTAPVVDSVTLSPSLVYTNDIITATAVFSDDDTTQLVSGSYAWHVVDVTGTDNEVLVGSDSALDGSLYFEKGDEVYVVVTPNDGTEDGTPMTSNSVEISNSAPTDITVELTPNSGLTNDQTVVCTATASDADTQDVLSYEYVWSTGATGASLALDSSFLPDSALVCTVTATDGEDSISGIATITIENRAPAVDSIAITPTSPTASTTEFTCVVSTSDADGETPSVVFAWYVDGTLLSAETSSTLTASYVLGQEITCEVTPFDAMEAGTAASSAVTIENTEPVANSVSFDGSMYYTNDTITATATISDIDAAQSTLLNASFEWHILDASDSNTDKVVQSGSDNTLDGASFFDRDDEVYVVVTPNDGTADGFTLTSSSITVLNTAPTEAVISISPDPAIEGEDDLTCSIDVEASDVDGDGIVYSYTWTDPDGQQTTTESANLTDVYAGIDTFEGMWTCEVTPFDMTDYAPTTSATVTVETGCPEEGDGSAVDCPALDCAKIMFDGYSTGDGVYWIDPDASGAFEVYCDMTTDGGGWTVFMVASATGATPDTSSSIIEPNASAQYAYMTHSNFASVGLNGNRVRAWNVSQPEVWLECDYADSGSDYKSWTATANCVQRVELVAGGYEDLSNTGYGGGFTYSSSYDTINPQNLIDNHSVFTKANSPGCCAGDPPGWTSNNSDINGAYTLFYGAWTSNYDDRLVYAMRRGYADSDGDGLAAWEDCDDDSSSTTTSGTGASEACAALSCLSILDDGYSTGSGLYWIDPQSTGAFQAYCDMDSNGGGWTRVARLDGTTPGYCGGDPSSSIDLSITPTLSGGKLADATVQAITASSSYNQVMYYTGEGGRAQFIYTTMNDTYDTTQSYGSYCTWTCADGSSDSTTCGSEYLGCGFSGRGSGGNAKKLYIGGTSGAHANALHSGGGFCGLDNRAQYFVDVFVR